LFAATPAEFERYLPSAAKPAPAAPATGAVDVFGRPVAARPSAPVRQGPPVTMKPQGLKIPELSMPVAESNAPYQTGGLRPSGGSVFNNR